MSERKEHTFHPIHQETVRNKILVRGRTKTHNSNPIHQETGGNVGTIQGKNIANAIECPSRHKTGPLYPHFKPHFISIKETKEDFSLCLWASSYTQ